MNARCSHCRLEGFHASIDSPNPFIAPTSQIKNVKASASKHHTKHFQVTTTQVLPCSSHLKGLKIAVLQTDSMVYHKTHLGFSSLPQNECLSQLHVALLHPVPSSFPETEFHPSTRIYNFSAFALDKGNVEPDRLVWPLW